MKEPRFTDAERWKTPYVPASATDIRKTFERITREFQKEHENTNQQWRRRKK